MKNALRPWPDDIARPEDLDDGKVRAILGAVARGLAASRRSDELSRFVAAGILSYLNDNVSTLDEAFALNRKGPRTRNRLRDIEIATKFWRFKGSAKAKKQRSAYKAFMLTIQEDYKLSSRRQIELIAKKYRPEARWNLMAERDYRRRSRIFRNAPTRATKSRN